MKDFDPADLDGDGSFDAIDIVILEGEEKSGQKQPVKGKSGCCLMLLAIGVTASTSWWVGWHLV